MEGESPELGDAGGVRRHVVEIPTRAHRVQGVVLDDGSRIEAPVVVNVAGPHSCKINTLAGAEGDMRITTRALRQDPTPPGAEIPAARRLRAGGLLPGTAFCGGHRT